MLMAGGLSQSTRVAGQPSFGEIDESRHQLCLPGRSRLWPLDTCIKIDQTWCGLHDGDFEDGRWVRVQT